MGVNCHCCDCIVLRSCGNRHHNVVGVVKQMDGFELLLGVFAAASVTTWLSVSNAQTTDRLLAMKFELVAMAVSWVAVLLVGLWVA